MGVGWEYFNNVCRAFLVTARLVGGIVGLIVLFLVGGSVMQFINANRASDPTLIVAPTATPAAPPIVKPNPQFMPPNTPGVPTPTNAVASPASTPASNPNPQFGQPRPTAPATIITPSGPTGALPDTKPNPQFSRKP